MTDGFDHRYVRVNDIRVHYVTAGEGPPVLLLHGFPEFWRGWRRQIPALAERFTVVAPDLRGYNETDRPLRGYETDTLVSDVAGLIAALGYERAALVGHDWGGALAWLTAMRYPQRVERLAVLNCPHPARFAQALRTSPSQLLRSWYMGFFQLPLLPEAFLSANNYAAIDQIFRGAERRPGTFSDEDLAAYKSALSRPGALTAALNYYRSGWQAIGRIVAGDVPPIEAPAMLIWGDDDLALGPELAEGNERYAPNLVLHRIPNCSHWVQHEQSDRVNELLLDFLEPLRERGGDTHPGS
jgi:pimeloyl-ACP methyl ester carboxylesterase